MRNEKCAQERCFTSIRPLMDVQRKVAALLPGGYECFVSFACFY